MSLSSSSLLASKLSEEPAHSTVLIYHHLSQQTSCVKPVKVSWNERIQWGDLFLLTVYQTCKIGRYGTDWTASCQFACSKAHFPMSKISYQSDWGIFRHSLFQFFILSKGRKNEKRRKGTKHRMKPSQRRTVKPCKQLALLLQTLMTRKTTRR